jgi:DNA-binding transcriptional LysR family regulator
VDIAIRIAELDDSSLVARKLAPCRKFFCASPAYLKEAGEPKTLKDLSSHKVLLENNTTWKLEGPEGVVTLKMASSIKTNSSEIVEQVLVSGYGIALRSSWQVREELLAKKLVPILPQYREAPGVAIFAVYPCKQFIPAKLRVFVDYLASIYAPEPYWDEGIEGILSNLGKKPARHVAQARA